MTDRTTLGPDRPVLILGGTGEAIALATLLVADGRRVVSSLAGRTTAPRLPPGEVRRGGFGGVDGLRDWLRAHRPIAVIDATHPFAETISAHAVAACAAEGVPRLALARPPWPSDPAWHRVASLAEAAARLPALGRRALLTVGATGLDAFTAPPGGEIIARVVTPPEPPPPGLTLVVARGPFTAEGETAFLRSRTIDLLVTKDSGGDATAPKLAAARALGVAVLVIDRPPRPPGPTAESPAAARAWLDSIAPAAP